jgi:peptide methionine sulfoxide reductase MsrA
MANNDKDIEAYLQAEKDIKQYLEKEHKSYIKPSRNSRKKEIEQLMSLEEFDNDALDFDSSME